jgi:hypothetical protein
LKRSDAGAIGQRPVSRDAEALRSGAPGGHRADRRIRQSTASGGMSPLMLAGQLRFRGMVHHSPSAASSESPAPALVLPGDRWVITGILVPGAGTGGPGARGGPRPRTALAAAACGRSGRAEVREDPDDGCLHRAADAAPLACGHSACAGLWSSRVSNSAKRLSLRTPARSGSVWRATRSFEPRSSSVPVTRKATRGANGPSFRGAKGDAGSNL